MPFINTIPENLATADVKLMYEKNLEEKGYIPNYCRIFSHRPQVLDAWGSLLRSIRSNMDTRRYELVTIAAAHALKSTYCMMAHSSVLLRQFYTSEQLTSIAKDYHTADLTPAEVAMMGFAERVVRDATAITQADIEELREYGFSDTEIFDITTTATARCFFSKTLDALGAEPDEIYLELEEELRLALTVGRSIGRQTSE